MTQSLQVLSNNYPKETYEVLLTLCEKEQAKRDPLWILETDYLFIKTKDEGIIPLRLNSAQKKLLGVVRSLREKLKPIRIIILKSRQVGMSTLSDAIIYCLTSQGTGVNSVIIADDEKGSNYLLEIVKLYHERSPVHLKLPERKSNEKKLEFFGNHSQIMVDTANNENAGRAHTYRYAHLSEVAMFNPTKIKNMMGGLMQTIPKTANSLVILESTAKGYGNYFQELWDKAEKKQNEWYPLFIAWFEDETYSMTPPVGFTLDTSEVLYKEDVKVHAKVELTDLQMFWRRFVIRNELNGDSELFKQEYPAYPAQAFLVTGRGRFDSNTLVQLKANTRSSIRTEGLWSIWEEPQTKPYVIGVDVAEGLEFGDNSVAQIIDPIDCKVVAKFRGKIEPEAFAYELEIWGKKYNDALIAVESNNHGLTVITILKDIYSNLYTKKIFDERGRKWTMKIGWMTTGKTKPLLIDNLSTALLDGFQIPSAETIEELFTFVVDERGLCSAQEGKLDDEVISLAIANQARIERGWGMEIKEKEPEPQPNSLEAYRRWKVQNQRERFN